MNERRGPWWVIWLPLAVGISLAIGFLLGTSLGAGRVSSKGFFLVHPAADGDKLDQVIRLIDRNYVDTVNSGRLVDEVLQDMLQRLDPHSYYISAADLQEAQEPLEGQFMGIGVEFNIQRDTVVVVSPVIGGPSEKLGIRAGDRIVSADGKNLAGTKISTDDVKKSLRGPEGSKVTVGIVRGQGKPFDVEIERGVIPIHSIDAAFIEANGTAYIKLSRFSQTTEREFVEATERLQAAGMKRLVLDLRGNGGGYLQAAIAICERLLPADRMIVYTEGRNSPRRDFRSGGGPLVDLPLAVLIDEGSASASEIVAGAMQDNDRAVVIGRRSFGKGLVQEHIELEDQSAVRITTARYYTPSGRCIQRPYGEGIDYDEEMAGRFDHGELLNEDSMRLDTANRFLTLKGRTVFGGGGIAPDHFVAADTSERSAYLSEMFFSGAINQFAFDIADRQRTTLGAYASAEDFSKRFAIAPGQLQELAREGAKLGVKENAVGMARSGRLLAERLKAGIARNIWREEGYYRVVLSTDPAFKKALEVLP